MFEEANDDEKNIEESNDSQELSNVEMIEESLIEEVEVTKDIIVEKTEEPIVENKSTDDTVTVQPVKFASFDDYDQMSGEENKNLDILMDVKLQLNVELGRCELPIKKVLELTRGSIIELDKVAGEPVELYANGKLVANGEVVVIDDKFGLRITSITKPEARLTEL